MVNYENHDNCWTFCSSLRVRRTIDFMNVNTWECSISDAFDLGSEHRAVFAQFSIPNLLVARGKNQRKKQTNWKNIDT